ncbi:hypothetical protein A0J61_11970, partial [Choanephora cucurbitarum]
MLSIHLSSHLTIPPLTDLLNMKDGLESLLCLSERISSEFQRDLTIMDPSKDNLINQQTPKQEELISLCTLIGDRQITFESLSKKREGRVMSPIVKLRRLHDMPPLAITVGGRKNRPGERAEPVLPIQDEIPILTFWSTLDPYFRPLTEEDRAYLMATDQDPTDYNLASLDRYSHIAINDYGLTERVLNSLILDDMGWIKEEMKAIDTIEFEERLKQELVYVGLLEEEITEEDEISAEFRLILDELRE